MATIDLDVEQDERPLRDAAGRRELARKFNQEQAQMFGLPDTEATWQEVRRRRGEEGRRIEELYSRTVASAARRPVTTSRPRERHDGSRRNSTRGSPDDDGPSEPASHARYCRWVYCGRLFVPKRSDALYCSASCRARALRDRRTPESDAKALKALAAGNLPAAPPTLGAWRPFDFGSSAAKSECTCDRPLRIVEEAVCFRCGHPTDRDRWSRLVNREARERSIDVGPRPLTSRDLQHTDRRHLEAVAA